MRTESDTVFVSVVILHEKNMRCVIQCVPHATRPGILFNNFTTNEDIATNFEADYRHIPLHFSHKERSSVQISLQ